jgi:hypothetical protein
VVYCGLLWSTLVYCGLLWSTVVYCGLLWSTVVYSGLFYCVYPIELSAPERFRVARVRGEREMVKGTMPDVLLCRAFRSPCLGSHACIQALPFLPLSRRTSVSWCSAALHGPIPTLSCFLPACQPASLATCDTADRCSTEIYLRMEIEDRRMEIEEGAPRRWRTTNTGIHVQKSYLGAFR